MPRERFDSLKDKKKENIIYAIQECLRKYDINTLSVNSIADEANIARGTFYTYFNDKNEALNTFFYYKLNDYINIFQQIVKDNDYKFFVSFKKAYYMLKEHISDLKYLYAVQNIVYCINQKDFFIMVMKYLCDYNDAIMRVYENTDIKNTSIKTTDNLRVIINIILSLYGHNLARHIYQVNDDTSDSDFEYEIDILEKGVK